MRYIYRWVGVIALFALILSSASCAVASFSQFSKGDDYSKQNALLRLTPDAAGDFDVALIVPTNVELTSWSISGNGTLPAYNLNDTFIYMGVPSKVYHWAFKNESSQTTVSYLLSSQITGSAKIYSIITYPGGVLMNDTIVSFGQPAVKAVCGNKICENALGETQVNCPGDCASASTAMVLNKNTLILGGILIALAIAAGIYLFVSKKKEEALEETPLEPIQVPKYVPQQPAIPVQPQQTAPQAPEEAKPQTKSLEEENDDDFWKDFDSSIAINKYEGEDTSEKKAPQRKRRK